jgi:protein-tyrosine-phosphatase
MRSILARLKSVAERRPVRIVFLCTANCTRSPLAEMLFEKLLIDATGSLEKVHSKNIVVESAGIYPSGFSISLKSREMLVREEGILPARCDAHRGRGIAEIDEPDLVLTMSDGHVLEVLEIFPAWKEKVFSLDGFVHRDEGKDGRDIDDPTGLAPEDYHAMKEIVKADLVLLLREFRDTGLIEGGIHDSWKFGKRE